jgi:hypothetical protein
MVGRYFSEAVIDDEAALFVYGLVGAVDHRPSVCVESTNTLRSPALRVKRRARSKMVGVKTLNYNNTKLRIFELERILCEMDSRKDIKVDSYLEKAKRLDLLDPKKLQKYDRLFKTNLAESAITEHSSSLPESPEVLERKSIVELAMRCYSEYGPMGLDLDFVSGQGEFSLEAIVRHFPDQHELKKAVYNERTSQLTSGVFELPPREGRTPKEFLRIIVDLTLTNVDTESEAMYRFQNWAIAEGHFIIKDTVAQVCSMLIKLSKSLILEGCPQIDEEEAECRASLLMGALDHYRQVRHTYIKYLSLSQTPEAFMRRYKATHLNALMDAMFIR